MVLQHDHSLSLIDLNPKYPHDEEVYDDEEDLIIKQAFQSSCDRCHLEITYYHRYYYKCDQCDYSLHKLCGEVPTELQHPSHSAHSLTLLIDKWGGQCDVCSDTIQDKHLKYHCSRCWFNICLGCATGDAQYLTIYHPSHQHPLIPSCRQRQVKAECDACGKDHTGVFYECPTCFGPFIHNDCIFQPKRLLIQDGTSDPFFHIHPLIMSYSFMEAYQKAKFYPTCRVCDKPFDNEFLWMYKCEKCRYYVHLDCAKSTSSNSYVDMFYEYYKSDPNVLRLPLPDQTYNAITDFLFKESSEGSITHNSHEHPLILVDTQCNDIPSSMHKVEVVCNGCVRPIIGVPFYKCTDQGCNFVLHEFCTRPPSVLKGHANFPQHTVTFLPKTPSDYFGIFKCTVCHYLCNGFGYYCVQCDFKVDLPCAIMRRRATHESHPRHMLSLHNGNFFTGKRRINDYCRMCLSGFKDTNTMSLTCAGCQFHLHQECAMLLPTTIRHKYDKHPMTLCYSPVNNHEGDYFCEVCEEGLNPNGSFYHCHECAQSMHTSCAPLRPQIKAYISNSITVEDVPSGTSGTKFWGYVRYKNIKFGSIHKNRDHPHPLTFHLSTQYDTDCSECGSRVEDFYVLMCLQCKYAIHGACFKE